MTRGHLEGLPKGDNGWSLVRAVNQPGQVGIKPTVEQQGQEADKRIRTGDRRISTDPKDAVRGF